MAAQISGKTLLLALQRALRRSKYRRGRGFDRFGCTGICSLSEYDSGRSCSGKGYEQDADTKVTGSSEDKKNGVELMRLVGSGLDFKCLNDSEKFGSLMENQRCLEFLDEVVAAPAHSVERVVFKWSNEREDIGHGEIYMAAVQLQKRRMYMKALKLMKWLEDIHKSDMTEEYYASHLHLICKVFGLEKAERYMCSIPLAFQGELVYGTLLENCVSPLNLQKAETVFNKMRDLQLPLSSLSCNQMIMLYKRLDVKNIVSVLFLMKKLNIKRNAETYHLLVDAKGEAKDIAGMDQLVKAMRSEGIEPDATTYSIMAKHYVSGGFKNKALDIIRKIEDGEIKRSPRDRCALLSLFALLGDSEGVDRIWKECEVKPEMDEYKETIEAWGKLGQVSKAEAVFENMYAKWKHLSSRHYSALLNIYVEHKLLDKGRELIKRMGDAGCWIGPLTWDALVRLFLGAGDVDKAASVLRKAFQVSNMRPMFQSYMCIMEQYATLGDIHNTEKIFQLMRQSGYVGRLKPFELLIQAYINAQAPAYGILERMKAENVCPNKSFTKKLARANTFMFKEVCYSGLIMSPHI